jgi:hypothetical protein
MHHPPDAGVPCRPAGIKEHADLVRVHNVRTMMSHERRQSADQFESDARWLFGAQQLRTQFGGV